MEMTINDCGYLQELVGEKDNEFLNSNDIIEFENCIKFMNKLGKNEKETFKRKKDIDIFNLFKEEVKKDNKIELYFTNYVNNYIELKSLFDSGLDKSEAQKKTIELLCKQSSFTLRNTKKKFFEGNYFGENKKQKKTIDLSTLLELRDRAQLTKNVTGDQKEKLENYRKFIDIVSEINNIYALLDELFISGYPELIEININIRNFECEYSGCKKKTSNHKDILSELSKMLTELKKAQFDA
jgi:hypothetical protein